MVTGVQKYINLDDDDDDDDDDTDDIDDGRWFCSGLGHTALLFYVQVPRSLVA